MAEPEKSQSEPRYEDKDILDDVVGTASWKRSKLGWLTGFGAARDAVSTVGRDGKESLSRTRIWLSLLASDKRGTPVNVATRDGSDLFERSLAVNRKTESDLARSIGVTHKQFWLYVALTLAAFLLGVVPVVLGGYAFPSIWPIELAFRLMLLPVTIALATRSGYTNWVMRRRSMEPFGSWVGSGEYLPSRVGSPRRAGALTTIALLLMTSLSVFAGGSQPAHAEDTTTPETIAGKIFGEPDSNDIFNKVLGYIAPDVGPIVAAEETKAAPQYDAIATGFMVFCATLMFVASNILAWQIISSIVASAKEGSMMGKKYHEVWAPIRSVVGFGMLAPIAGGFCAAQIVVLYLIVWGGNLANIVWVPYVERLTVAGGDDFQKKAVDRMRAASSQDAAQVTGKLFERLLCNETVRTYYKRNYYGMLGQATYAELDGSSKMTRDTTWYGREYVDGDKVSYSLDLGSICGTVTVQWSPDLGKKTSDAANIVGEAQVEAINQLVPVLLPAARTAAESYQNVEGATAARVFASDSSEQALRTNLKAVKAAMDTYDKIMATAAEKAFQYSDPYKGGGTSSVMDAMRKDIASNGWAAAGMYYVTLGRVQNAIYERSRVPVSFPEINPDRWIVGSDDLKLYLVGNDDGTSQGVLTQFRDWWRSSRGSVASHVSARGMNVAAESTDFWSSLGSWSIYFIEAYDTDSDPHPLNPMQDMIDAGNSYLYSGLGLYAALKASELVANTYDTSIVGKTTGLAGVRAANLIEPIGTALAMISVLLMAVGIVHAFIIPMIPYVMTVFFVGSMLILVVEALVAAPIWAFLHIRLDGEEFIDQVQRPGYMIAFNLILRPVLMIFGLMLSMLIFGAMTFFVSQTFKPAMEGMNASNGLGLFGFLVMISILTYLHFLTSVRAFTLILRLPDRVTRWFGQNDERLGEEEDFNETKGVLISHTSRRMEGLTAAGATKPRMGGRQQRRSIEDKPSGGDEGSETKNAASGNESGVPQAPGGGDFGGSSAKG